MFWYPARHRPDQMLCESVRPKPLQTWAVPRTAPLQSLLAQIHIPEAFRKRSCARRYQHLPGRKSQFLEPEPVAVRCLRPDGFRNFTKEFRSIVNLLFSRRDRICCIVSVQLLTA